MRTISEKALYLRAKRFYSREDKNIIFKKHNKTHVDMIMNGDLYVYAVNRDNNSIEWYQDHNTFIDECRRLGILKEDEKESK